MNKPLHNIVLATDHGTMIVNRHEMRHVFGVAATLADNGCYEPQEVGVLRDVIRHLPAQPVVFDIGANIGVHTLEFARATHALGGEVHAFEAQRQVFYMLAGNVAINSHFNVHCHHAAMGAHMASIEKLISTPRFHHWHHTNDGADVANKNYAALLPIWDRLFGSLHLPAASFPATYGSTTALPAGILKQLMFPFGRSR